MGPRAAPSSHPHRGGGDETAYARRRPEESVLYGAVQSELEGFLFRAQAHERPVPRFVERELRGFLGCGILAHGFVRVHCRLLYRLKHPWRDGATHVLFERLELLEKLAALVPPPRFHLVATTASSGRAPASATGSCLPLRKRWGRLLRATPWIPRGPALPARTREFAPLLRM